MLPLPLPISIPGSDLSRGLMIPVSYPTDITIPKTVPISGASTVSIPISQKAGSSVDPLTIAGFASAAKGVLDSSGGAQVPTTATSSADSKSGDINQTVSFGDFIVNGSKFSPFNTFLLIGVALGSGLFLLSLFKKKAKK